MRSWIIRLPFSDRPDIPILIHITQKVDGHELDLDLLATEGDSAYRAKIRYRKIDKLKSSGYDGTLEDWSDILRYTLVSKANTELVSSVKDNLVVTCNKLENASKLSLVVLFRTRVQDITHKLGAIELPETSDHTDDVDLFGWTCQTIDRRDELEAALAKSAVERQVGEKTIQSLEQQLEDLIKAKEDHEHRLLRKFVLLLNEKKLKIRNQQRLLSELKDDSLSGERSSGKKRKRAQTSDTTADDASDETDGFEATVEGEERDRLDSVPDQADKSSQDSAADDGSDIEGTTRRIPRSAGSTRSASRDTTPPPRTLSFSKQKDVTKPSTASAKTLRTRSSAATGDDDDDTASEDDEL